MGERQLKSSEDVTRTGFPAIMCFMVKRVRRRIGTLLLLSIVVGIIISAPWLTEATSKAHGLQSQLAPFYVAIIAGFVVPGLLWLGRRTIRPINVSNDVDVLLGILENALWSQWMHEAARRRLREPAPMLIPWQRAPHIAGPVSAATGSDAAPPRFQPLPGCFPVLEKSLSTGTIDDLFHIYAGLASGRLLIVGQPGAGKTAASILLMVRILEERRRLSTIHRESVPVPVVFDIAGWDPQHETIQSWLASQISDSIEHFSTKPGRSAAEMLVSSGRISVILDSLDTLPAQSRPYAIQALSEQASFRLVLFSRTDAALDALKTSRLVGAAALELQPISSLEASRYLLRGQVDPPTQAWSELRSELQGAEDSPLKRALMSPLAVALAYETCRTDSDVRHLLDLAHGLADQTQGAAIIDDFLLDHLIPSSYESKLGESTSNYQKSVAEHTLHWIAHEMSKDSVAKFTWWWIDTKVPQGVVISCRILASIALVGLVTYSIAGVAAAVWAACAVAAGSAFSRPKVPSTHVSGMLDLAYRGVFGIGLGIIVGISLAFKRLVYSENFPQVGRLFRLGFKFYFHYDAGGSGSPVFAGIAITGFLALIILAAMNYESFKNGNELRGFRPESFRWSFSILSLALVSFSLQVYRVYHLPASRGTDGWFLAGTISAAYIAAVGVLAFCIMLNMLMEEGMMFRGAIIAVLIGAALMMIVSTAIIALNLLRFVVTITVGGLLFPVSLTKPRERPFTPLGSWSDDRRSGALTVSFVALLAAFSSFCIAIVSGARAEAFAVCFIAAIIGGLLAGQVYARSWTACLAFLYLHIRYHTPLQMMKFLEDACNRNVLHVVGADYEFRHSRLQERLIAHCDNSRWPCSVEPHRAFPQDWYYPHN
jgi:hypothetical protein